MARLYLDENLGGFSQQFRDAGHDVVTADDPGRKGRTDAWHFREAIADQRIILTWDRPDFEYLHRLWTSLQIMGVVSRTHPGILTKKGPRSFREEDWIKLVLERLQTPGDFDGRMFVWQHSNAKWVEHQWRPEA